MIRKGLVKQLRTAGHNDMANHLVNLGAANRRPVLSMRPVADPILGVVMAAQPNDLGLTVIAAVDKAEKMLAEGK